MGLAAYAFGNIASAGSVAGYRYTSKRTSKAQGIAINTREVKLHLHV